MVVGIGFTVLMKLQPLQVHHLIDICKSIVDTRNMFVLKHLGQYIFLLRCQCGEKIILRLVVLRLGKPSPLTHRAVMLSFRSTRPSINALYSSSSLLIADPPFPSNLLSDQTPVINEGSFPDAPEGFRFQQNSRRFGSSKKDMGRTCVGLATAHSRDVANRSAVWSAFSRSPR